MWDGKGFVIAPIVGGETGVSVEYLPPDDGRQYNIEPYRMATISERTPETINEFSRRYNGLVVGCEGREISKYC